MARYTNARSYESRFPAILVGIGFRDGSAWRLITTGQNEGRENHRDTEQSAVLLPGRAAPVSS